jgi:hypothetical protein
MDLKEAVTVCCEPAGSAIGVELLPTRTRVSAATAAGSASELEDAAVVVKLVKIVAASNDAYGRASGVQLLPTRFPALASELVGLKVDVIVAGSSLAARAAQQAMAIACSTGAGAGPRSSTLARTTRTFTSPSGT